MRTVGLITEYNPFHNGHLHHLQQSLCVADAEISVAVMSGHFLQRGEPALVDKWVRTEMALAAGVDVIVELPLPWACSSAPDFARGAVQALQALGGIDALCFGSEAGEIDSLRSCAQILLSRAGRVEKKTAALLRQGVNYPQARARILSELLADPAVEKVLAEPNNILGIEYLKALAQIESHIEPFTIQRIGAGFHQTEVGEGQIASATGIRKLLAEGRQIDGLIPASSAGSLQQTLEIQKSFNAERYLVLLLSEILRNPYLNDVWLVEEGIDNRLRTVAEKVHNLDDLISTIKSRQLTRTRIQRLLVAVLLGIQRQEALGLLQAGPRYLHLLGVSEKGQQFLSKSRKHRQLPLVQNFSRIHSSLKRFYQADPAEHRLALQQLNLQLRATQIYSLLLHTGPMTGRNRDFYEPLRRK